MRRYLLALSLVALICSPGCSPVSPAPTTLAETDKPVSGVTVDTPLLKETARVIRVIDGDTIVVGVRGTEYTVRYIGIDAPESVKPDSPVEPFGPEASAKNRELVEGRLVSLEKDISETDRFGRLLRYVYIGDLFVNGELVRLGYARAISYPPDIKYQELLVSLQREARADGRGLWGLK